jgi:hypothetical protein
LGRTNRNELAEKWLRKTFPTKKISVQGPGLLGTVSNALRWNTGWVGLGAREKCAKMGGGGNNGMLL